MPEKVLIVEDETALRETLAYTLEREGFDVRAVDDGAKALTAAAEQNPDIILLDIMLPGIDGFEVCRRLRARMNIPILMLTARETKSTASSAWRWARTITSPNRFTCGNWSRA